jgi:hypothetical protein
VLARRKCLERVLGIELWVAATAALDQPGGERAALWQRPRGLATMRHSSLYLDARIIWHFEPIATIQVDVGTPPPWGTAPAAAERKIDVNHGVFEMQGVVTKLVLATAFMVLTIAGAPTAAFADGYDGNWTVLVVTERGTCDRNYSYDVSVSQGKINYPSYTSVSMYGTVSPQGAVMVSIRHLDDIASGSGHLSARAGGGGWRGVGRNGSCSGHWKAHRR